MLYGKKNRISPYSQSSLIMLQLFPQSLTMLECEQQSIAISLQQANDVYYYYGHKSSTSLGSTAINRPGLAMKRDEKKLRDARSLIGRLVVWREEILHRRDRLKFRVQSTHYRLSWDESKLREIKKDETDSRSSSNDSAIVWSWHLWREMLSPFSTTLKLSSYEFLKSWQFSNARTLKYDDQVNELLHCTREVCIEHCLPAQDFCHQLFTAFSQHVNES